MWCGWPNEFVTHGPQRPPRSCCLPGGQAPFLPRHTPGSVREETSATGQRVKGAMKDAVGDLTDNDSLEDKGERENAAGRERQKKNDAV